MLRTALPIPTLGVANTACTPRRIRSISQAQKTAAYRRQHAEYGVSIVAQRAPARRHHTSISRAKEGDIVMAAGGGRHGRREQ